MKKFSELDFIKEIREMIPFYNNRVIKGIGDDTAVIRCAENTDLLYTCDLMTEGVHFSLDYFTPGDIGWRALAANISDIASMGGKPLYFTLSVAVPPHLKTGSFLDEFIKGIIECAGKYGVHLIGGDTSSSKESLFIDISMIGETETGKALMRSGASPGDFIYILGNPGKAEAGLQLFLKGWRLSKLAAVSPEGQTLNARENEIITRIMLTHLRPAPCVEAGRKLSETGIPSAMIDTSDGISTDLFHICEESGVGAELNYSAFDEIELTAVKELLPELDIYNCLVNGGEDYTLLFTVPEQKKKILESLNPSSVIPPPRCIGKITKESGRMTIDIPGKGKMPLKPSGWEHR